MRIIISLFLISALCICGSVLALSLDEIYPIKVTQQNQNQYNIDVKVSIPTDTYGDIVNKNTEIRTISFKAPIDLDGRKISSVHMEIISKKSQDVFVSVPIFFYTGKEHASNFFHLSIKVIKNAKINIFYDNSDNFYEIDLKSYIENANQPFNK